MRVRGIEIGGRGERRVAGLAAALLVGACLAGCTGGSGSSSSAAPPAVVSRPSNQVIVSAGSAPLVPDATVVDRSSAADRARLGIAAFDQSYTLTTPARDHVELSFAGSVAGSHGPVAVRFAMANGTGFADGDMATVGLLARAGNLMNGDPAWIETRGDGFARLTIYGSIAQDQTLILEREADGRKTHAAVTLRIGPPSAANPSFQVASAYPGLVTRTALFSSEAPLFGLPAIAGSGDRVSVVCYDSTYTGAPSGGGGGVPAPQPGALGLPRGLASAQCVIQGVERQQRRLQLDVTTGAATMGATTVVGNDSTSWRDTEVAGLYNVIAIAQSGEDGVKLSLSYDRGATFPQDVALATGALTRLVKVAMAADYTTGVIAWAGDGSAQRLILVEGRPSAWDQNQSPSAFAFDPPRVLFSTGAEAIPLVSDLRYTSCGDLFVAFGVTEWTAAGGGGTTRIECARRLSGALDFAPPVLVDEVPIVSFDPSIAVLGCGASAQVFVAYESDAGVRVRRSDDGGATFAASADVGSSSAHAPRVFARAGAGGTAVDCIYVDSSAALGADDLCLFHAAADLTTGRAVYALVPAKQVSVAGGGTEIEGVGWFGFDATELGASLFVAVHTQRGRYLTYPVGGVFARGGAAGGPLAANAPAVLYPGMTQAVPPFDAAATHKLWVLEIR